MPTTYKTYRYRSVPADTIRWRGYWITSYRFYHLPACRPYGHDRLRQFNSEIQNIHTLFRKTFRVSDKPLQSAKLYITGDDLYKLYINGQFVGEGPAQSYPFAYNYNCYDVTDLIEHGDNTIGVHLYYQGLFNIYLISADNLCGMIAQLVLTYEDGTVQTVVSDGSWLYRECDAYTPQTLYGYQTQFSEDIDLNRYPSGWNRLTASDDGWERALIAANPYPQEYSLVPQRTPTVSHTVCYPTEIRVIENGYLFDFGKEMTGNLVFSVCGTQGHVIETRFGEELCRDGRVRYQIRANCTYSDRITLTGNEDTVPYYDYKAYRYAEILNPPPGFDPASVYTLCRHYPFPEMPAQFLCSCGWMNDLWEICRRGVMIGTQDTYYDCPTREKGGFVGDALITGLSHLILTADTRIYRKFIEDCTNTARICPAMMGHLPTYDINIDADYSALIPLFLLEYYNYTADAAFLAEHLPTAEGIWAYYSGFLNEDGLLARIRHMPKVPQEVNILLVDWPQNLRDGYDNDAAFDSVCTPVNMLFYGFLKTLSALYGIVGDRERAAELEIQYTAMGNALIAAVYDEKTGLFLDMPGSDHASLHANALPLFFGLEPPRGYQPLIDLIEKKRLNCGVYFAYFVIGGLYRVGAYDLAYDLLTGKDEHSWYNMLTEGATTCMEVWGADQKWNTSWCHPWSSSPIYFFTAYLMGIRQAAPGMRVFRIEPQFGKDLTWAELTMPIPAGVLSVKLRRDDGHLYCTVSAPKEIEITFSDDPGIHFERIFEDQ